MMHNVYHTICHDVYAAYIRSMSMMIKSLTTATTTTMMMMTEDECYLTATHSFIVPSNYCV